MDLSAVDLNLLVALDLLLEERSVRAAARRAHVSASAMSHTLGRLRALLGDELLVRAGRGMVPTPRAEALAAPLRALLTETRALLAEPAAFSPETLEAAFRVVCTDHVTTVLLPELDRLLAAQAPGVDLYLCPLLPELTAQLRKGEVDLAIGIFPEAPPELRVRRLFTDGFVTVARRDHPRLQGKGLSLAQYLAEEHLLVAPRGTPEGLIDQLLAAQGLRRRVARTVPHFLSALWHVAESDRLLTVSRRLVSATTDWLPLRVFPAPLAAPDYTLVMLWHPRNDEAPEQRWLRELLLRASQALR